MHPLLHLIMSSHLPLRDLATLSVAELKSIAFDFNAAHDELDKAIDEKTTEEFQFEAQYKDGVYWITTSHQTYDETLTMITIEVKGFFIETSKIYQTKTELTLQLPDMILRCEMYEKQEASVEHIEDSIQLYDELSVRINQQEFVRINTQLKEYYSAHKAALSHNFNSLLNRVKQ